MKNTTIFLSSCILLLLIACGGAQDSATTAKEFTEVETLIKDKKFKVENQWAMPQVSSSMVQLGNSGILGPGNNMQRISLIGNTNYLEIKGDSAKAFLPYYGERQMGGGYNSDGEGIQFEQEITDMQVDFIENKQRYKIQFTANNGAESFNVTLLVFPNKKTSLSVNSSQRDFITYDGTISELSKE
ncbi:DUF4251 domain-containing protein [Galbibacter orientalis]|uniref:DUF4251 domain-containing protein n=1 Tax=Galbibacter orientalis DSM 19592 TaxID=926559 RepID=I3C8M1_9FLAO|nr:DUF4251 domain-containing protein [Galbibacter orientalis]EIJ39964.1 hypothetical protein JoomaDRAFT_3010 [Galbibacter orientalis DSM 19592]